MYSLPRHKFGSGKTGGVIIDFNFFYSICRKKFNQTQISDKINIWGVDTIPFLESTSPAMPTPTPKIFFLADKNPLA